MHVIILKNITDSFSNQGKHSLSYSDHSELHDMRHFAGNVHSFLTEVVLVQEKELNGLDTSLSNETGRVKFILILI